MGAASAAASSAPVPLAGSSASMDAGAGRRQHLNARQQQELADEAYARQLVMEERHGQGGFADRAGSSFGPHHRVLGMGMEENTVRAACPHCGAHNEFASAGAVGATVVRCGQCSGEFQAALPPPAAGRAIAGAGVGGRAVHLCRRCGTINQYPVPNPGAPLPDVQCGSCGAVTVSLRSRPGRQRAHSEMAEQMQMLMDPRNRPLRGAGPLVRLNVGGQQRVVPLAVLLAFVAEEMDTGNPAHHSDIAALPTRQLKGTENLGEQHKCLICLEEFGDGDDLKTLPCLHIYHQSCVEQWLHTDNSCPCCKTPISEQGRR